MQLPGGAGRQGAGRLYGVAGGLPEEAGVVWKGAVGCQQVGEHKLVLLGPVMEPSGGSPLGRDRGGRLRPRRMDGPRQVAEVRGWGPGHAVLAVLPSLP